MAAKSKSRDEYIEWFSKVHKNFYNYSKLEIKYPVKKQKIAIICPLHGEFFQDIYKHAHGQGCEKCMRESRITPLKDRLNQFIKIHGSKYDYSQIDFSKRCKNVEELTIICPIHGEFKQKIVCHLRGQGCWKCGSQKLAHDRRTPLEERIKKAQILHDNFYDYSRVNNNYSNGREKVEIICPDHGSFFLCMGLHTRNKNPVACKSCWDSRGEKKIREFLSLENIIFKTQKTFPNLKGSKGWCLRFDFYLPEHNTCIEFDGQQHFKPINYFGGQKVFEDTQIRDSLKNTYCQEKNLRLIRIRYDENVEARLREEFPLS